MTRIASHFSLVVPACLMPIEHLEIEDRMKETLVLLGGLESALVRPSLCRLPEDEIRRIEMLLKLARLSPEYLYQPIVSQPAIA